MKYLKKITAAALAVLLLSTLAAPAFAAAAPSEKEEVIYILTDASGKVTDLEVVNIFAGGEITDYGDYSAVKVLNTTDPITQSGDRITLSSAADQVYYQGTMKNTVIPWHISIRCTVDGTEYAAEDLAGKSGALEIHFSVSKNKNCPGSFYEDYALQASFTLDTERCSNLVSNGATVANVGSKKQLTYTILPGRGIDTVIQADVRDFEMDAVTINGVRLNLDLAVDDAALMDQVDAIVSAISRIDDGAGELSEGTGELYEATGTLNGKVFELNAGVGTLTNGAGDLYAGLAEIAAKNSQLTNAAYTAYEGLCSAAAMALNSQLRDKGLPDVTLTPSTYSSVLLGLLARMDADAVYQEAYQTALQQITRQVEAQAEALYRGYIESQADAVYMAYVTAQADALYAQVAAQAVYAQLLQNGYTELQAAAYLESPEGQAAVAQAAAKLTAEQKADILYAAVAGLTDGQKEQILRGAVASLTEEQKTQIREAYIQQMMASDEVAAQIGAAVAEVSTAAKHVSEVKGQLDNYGAFYQGLLDYTGAVGDAAAGAKTLKLSMDTLYSNTGMLRVSVGELNEAVGRLYVGAQDLANGTSAFVDQTAGMNTQISDEIDEITSGVTGSGAEVRSFVSAQNTHVDSVQFVIKTAAIEKTDIEVSKPVEEAPLTFWQKLLRLFGLY